jgi:hypothetical protein
MIPKTVLMTTCPQNGEASAAPSDPRRKTGARQRDTRSRPERQQDAYAASTTTYSAESGLSAPPVKCTSVVTSPRSTTAWMARKTGPGSRFLIQTAHHP